eukprot:358957-Chlamydomonas_euryale.AAC.2
MRSVQCGQSTAATRAFLMAPPDCRAINPRKSNEQSKAAAAIDPQPYATHAPYTEGPVYKPSIPAWMCDVHV